MNQPYRNPTGGQIDRDTVLEFSFEGRRYQGHPGDTLASALLANGVRLVGRSFKYHRPRGIVSAGPEEPSALVRLGHGPAAEPNTRATQVELLEGLEARAQNCWPGLQLDLLAVNNLASPLIPAGFYYKTFMAPRKWWPWYERLIRRAAGMGSAATGNDPDHYLGSYAHCDILVVGAGPAGLTAARVAAGSGARVILVDENPEPGGWLRRERESLDGVAGDQWSWSLWRELCRLPNVRALPRTTAFGYYDHNLVAAVQRFPGTQGSDTRQGPAQRLWRIRARRVVLATGAIERPLVFGNNDRPGVMLAGAARAYLNQYATRAGSRAVVATNNDSAYRAAAELADGGVKIAAVLDNRNSVDPALLALMEDRGIPVDLSHAVQQAHGRRAVNGVSAAPLDGGRIQRIDCDLLCVSGGWAPAVHLHAQSGGRPRYSAELAAFVPGPAQQAERSAGAARGILSLRHCLEDGRAAGREAVIAIGGRCPDEVHLPPVDSLPGAEEYRQKPLWAAPRAGARSKQFVDLQDDVTTADIELAHREGYTSVEHLKRYTTLGMGTDQGKTSNINGMALLARLRDEPIPQVGTTTFRPPYTPVTLGALAGAETGPHIKPRRRTPLHEQHQALGAVFAPLGLWDRPQAYPRPDESIAQAVDREARSVRRGIGLTDVSTLSKFSVQGPDAGRFLDALYVNNMSTLAVGRCRYGLMLREDGMIFDDGTVTRDGQDSFFVTGTSGNAAATLQHMDYHLSVVWPWMDVHLCEVTEQFAAVALAGPRSRTLLQELAPEADLSTARLPHMGTMFATVAGLAARICRISFSGEVAFEIYVPASQGKHLWAALTGNEAHGRVTPYGMDALEVLRIEKGYIGMGAEADGRTTPADLGLDRMLSRKKRWVGQAALERPGLQDTDRLQLVGLAPLKTSAPLPEGAQVLADPAAGQPGCSIGHVSSSAVSPHLGHAIALALVRGGRARLGQTLYLADPARGNRQFIPVRVCEPCFLDPAGERLHA